MSKNINKSISEKKVADLSISDAFKWIRNNEVNHADVLAEKIGNDTKKLTNWIFNMTNVKIKQSAWERDENGHIQFKFNEIIKKKYTCNGEERVIDLINLAKRYESSKLLEVVDKAVKIVVDGLTNDDYYYIRKENGNYEKRVMDASVDNICKAYLEVPKSLQNKNTLIKFFHNYENLDSLKSSGYRAAKHLIIEFKDQLNTNDIKVLSNYIYSRLERMENRMIAFNSKIMERKINSLIDTDPKRNENPSIMLISSLKKRYEELAQLNSDSYKTLKAKYNKELSRYFQILKPICAKRELENASGKDKFVELYSDLEKTYEIINDEAYKMDAYNNDKQIARLKNYIDSLMAEYKKQTPPSANELQIRELFFGD